MRRIDLRKVRRFSIKSRYSKVQSKNITHIEADAKNKSILDLIPSILAGKDLKNLVKSIFVAKKLKKPVIVMMGAHPIKCGLSPLIIELMKRGFITNLAANGACLVHDFEMALHGSTSEEVDHALADGSFGMTLETGTFLNAAASRAAQDKKGLGSTFGSAITEAGLPHAGLSIFAKAVEHAVTPTVHCAIGTDIYFQHPECRGADWGETSYRDFLEFCEAVSLLGEGGVVMNFGSAVIMPEIFLKALSISRNLGYSVKNFTTANFDMIRQYRPMTNVVTRPVLKGGAGYNFVGHHEIMIPLLYACLAAKEARKK